MAGAVRLYLLSGMNLLLVLQLPCLRGGWRAILAPVQVGVSDPSVTWGSRQQTLTLGLLCCKVIQARAAI